LGRGTASCAGFDHGGGAIAEINQEMRGRAGVHHAVGRSRSVWRRPESPEAVPVWPARPAKPTAIRASPAATMGKYSFFCASVALFDEGEGRHDRRTGKRHRCGRRNQAPRRATAASRTPRPAPPIVPVPADRAGQARTDRSISHRRNRRLAPRARAADPSAAGHAGSRVGESSNWRCSRLRPNSISLSRSRRRFALLAREANRGRVRR